jgi:hypothetical protein
MQEVTKSSKEEFIDENSVSMEKVEAQEPTEDEKFYESS